MNKKFICENCDGSFVSQSSLNMHLKSAKKCNSSAGNQPNTRFICDYCEKQYTQKINLTKHLNTCRSKIIKQANAEIEKMTANNTTEIQLLEDDRDKIVLKTEIEKLTTNNAELQILRDEHDKNVHALILEKDDIIKKLQSTIEEKDKVIANLTIKLARSQAYHEGYADAVENWIVRNGNGSGNNANSASPNWSLNIFNDS